MSLDVVQILQGDVIAKLRELPTGSVHCCITSPPYWGLRDYEIEPSVWGGVETHKHCFKIEEVETEIGGGNWAQGVNGRGEEQPGGADLAREPVRSTAKIGRCYCGAWQGALGLEPTYQLYVEHLVAVFREVGRVLRDDGTVWLNLGDSSVGSPGGFQGKHGQRISRTFTARTDFEKCGDGLKSKDLVGIPWRVAFALQADGWYLRSDIIWHKPNPMPESVADRPTKSHEHVFLLAKQRRYFYDGEAIKEPVTGRAHRRSPMDGSDGGVTPKSAAAGSGIRANESFHAAVRDLVESRNRRDVWSISTQPYKGAHFATWPEGLVKPMILAGTSAWGCCPTCGAPWERVFEDRPIREVQDYGGKWSDSDPQSSGRRILANTRAARSAGGDHDNPFPTRATVGWTPTCGCGLADPVPCTVLDPFAGSGTTGAVAVKLGRKAVLIELNPSYVALIEERCRVTLGLPGLG